MTSLGYHVSHEQFDPRTLLDFATAAEAAGFDAAFSSDHLQPWGDTQGESGHLWSWLGAALERTRRLTFGAITVPGGWRYHPVVTAHALGTLARMYPGRIPWIALGSGEAINERTVGAGWPDKDERDARLAEAAVIVRRLLAGETVDHEGLLRVEKAKLWSLPDDPPRLIGAALSVGGARRVAAWADGLLTSCADLDELRRIVEAFRANGGAGKPIHLKVELSWADTERAALEQAHRQWRYLLPGRRASQELKTPDEFDAASRDASMVEIRKLVNVSSRPEDHIAWLRKRLDIGLASIDIHDVGENQSAFIETFGREVLPELRQTIAVAAGDEP